MASAVSKVSKTTAWLVPIICPIWADLDLAMGALEVEVSGLICPKTIALMLTALA